MPKGESARERLAMVAQDHALLLSKRIGDRIAFTLRQNYSSERVEQGAVVVERASILSWGPKRSVPLDDDRAFSGSSLVIGRGSPRVDHAFPKTE